MTEHVPSCDELAEMLSAAIDGEADAAELRLVDDHLARCADCRRRWDADRTVRRRLLLAPAPPVAAIIEATGTIPLPNASHRRRTVTAAVVAAAVVLVAVGSFALFGWNRGDSTRRHVATGTATVDHDVHTVEITDERFATSHVVVDPGTRVRWANADTVVHDLVVHTPGAVVDSELHPRNVESVTFTRPGTFEFSCRIHAGMAGSVTVVAR